MQDHKDEYQISGWHLKKEVTIGQIITMCMLCVSGFWWASNVEARLMHLNGEIRRVEELQKIQFGHIENLFNRIDRKLNKIDDKIESKMDKK